MPQQGRRKRGIGKHQLGREHLLAQQTLRPVEIGQDGVEQHGPLDDGGFDGFPFGRIHHQRNRIERPGARGALRIAVDVVGDAVVVDQPLPFAPAAREAVVPHRGERFRQRSPVRAELLAGAQHFVVEAGRGLITPRGIKLSLRRRCELLHHRRHRRICL